MDRIDRANSGLHVVAQQAKITFYANGKIYREVVTPPSAHPWTHIASHLDSVVSYDAFLQQSVAKAEITFLNEPATPSTTKDLFERPKSFPIEDLVGDWPADPYLYTHKDR